MPRQVRGRRRDPAVGGVAQRNGGHFEARRADPAAYDERSAYKLIKSSGSAVEWETGADRWLVVDPTDLRMTGRDGRVALELSWR